MSVLVCHCLLLSVLVAYAEKPQGRVHVHVEYEPKGILPGPNDVVFLESFAR